MDLHVALKKLHDAGTHKNLPKSCFLAHAFVMHEGIRQEWQLGYFCPEEDRMLSFVVDDDITELPPAEVLKTDTTIRELDPEDVRIGPDEALATADKVRTETYKGVLPIKTFFLIQHLKDGALYNITFVTNTFTTLNVKVDAKTGAVIAHSNESLISFDKDGPAQLVSDAAAKKHGKSKPSE